MMNRAIEIALIVGLLSFSIFVGIHLLASEQPMTTQEREQQRQAVQNFVESEKEKARVRWRRAEFMKKEAEYTDDDYLHTRGNHRWCAEEVEELWARLAKCYDLPDAK